MFPCRIIIISAAVAEKRIIKMRERSECARRDAFISLLQPPNCGAAWMLEGGQREGERTCANEIVVISRYEEITVFMVGPRASPVDFPFPIHIFMKVVYIYIHACSPDLGCNRRIIIAHRGCKMAMILARSESN